MDKELSSREQELLANFKWDDVSESELDHPYFDICKDIEQCVEKIINYVIETITLDSWNGDDFLEVTIPVTVHPLLQDRFSMEYTDESRFALFDLLRAVFRLKFDSVAYQLNDKIQKLLPNRNESLETFFKEEMQSLKTSGNFEDEVKGEYRTGADTNIKVKSIDLYDEPMMDIIVSEKLCGSSGSEETKHIKEKREGKSISAEITLVTYRN